METQEPQAVQIEGLILPTKSSAAPITAVVDGSSIQKATLHKLLNEPMLACTNGPQNSNLAHNRISKNNNNNNSSNSSSSSSSSSNNNNNNNMQKVAFGPQNSNLKEGALSSLLGSDKPAVMEVDPVPAAGGGEKVTVEKVTVEKVVVTAPLSSVEENCSTTSTNSSIVNRYQAGGFQNRTIHGGHHLEVGKSGSRSAFHSISERDASSYRNLRDRSNRKPIQERPRQKRQTLQDMTRPLKVWLYHHRDNPYPSKSEKVQLTKSSQMTMTQVSNWFANARRRLKNTVRDPELTWAKRIKLYNSYVEGNQELLSVGSSSSSSSDDDLRDDLTEQDGNLRAQGEQESSSSSSAAAAAAQCIQEENGGQHQQTGISNNSALADQGIQQADNLLDRLSGNTHMRFEPLTTEEHETSPGDAEPMDQTPQVQSIVESRTSSSTNQDQLQHNSVQSEAAEQSHPVHQPPVGTVAGFGDVESSLGDCAETAPKYKTNIMQRYLNDSYQSAMHSLNSLASRDLKESERHRNPSGSLSSHDYEEYMSSASSARSTPTREHQDAHVDEYEEYSRFWPDIKSRAEDDLYWKEISAALALTSLARSRYSTQSH